MYWPDYLIDVIIDYTIGIPIPFINNPQMFEDPKKFLMTPFTKSRCCLITKFMFSLTTTICGHHINFLTHPTNSEEIIIEQNIQNHLKQSTFEDEIITDMNSAEMHLYMNNVKFYGIETVTVIDFDTNVPFCVKMYIIQFFGSVLVVYVL